MARSKRGNARGLGGVSSEQVDRAEGDNPQYARQWGRSLEGVWRWCDFYFKLLQCRGDDGEPAIRP